MAVLITGTVVSTILAIGQARALAEAEAVSDLLQNDLIAAVNPETSKGSALTIGSFLDIVSKSVEAELKDMPIREASICATLGRTFRMLGRYKDAERHRERAYQLYHEQLGENHVKTLKSLADVAQIYGDRGRYEEAKRIYTTVGDRNGAALMLMALGRYEEAEQLWVEMLQTQARVQEQWLNPVIDPFVTGNLGELYTYQGRYDEAEKFLLQTIKDDTAQWGKESPFMLAYMSRLGAVYRSQGRYHEAEKLLVETLEISNRLWGEREWHYATLHCKSELAQLYTDQGRYNEAEPICVKVLDTGRNMLGNQHSYTLIFINRLAALYSAQGCYIDSEALFKEAIETGRQKFGDDHPNTLESIYGLAVLYQKLAQYEQAEQFLLKALEGRRLKLGDTHPYTIKSLDNLIALYQAWGKPEQAEQWKGTLSGSRSRP